MQGTWKTVRKIEGFLIDFFFSTAIHTLTISRRRQLKSFSEAATLSLPVMYLSEQEECNIKIWNTF